MPLFRLKDENGVTIGFTREQPLLSPVERFFKFVQKTDDCWQWAGATQKGYGRFYAGNRMVLAHRFSYELAKGPIPDHLQINHECDNPWCVNPDHLYAGTQQHNMDDRDRRERRRSKAELMANITNHSARRTLR